jgi:hypothetical protein
MNSEPAAYLFLAPIFEVLCIYGKELFPANKELYRDRVIDYQE